MVSTCELDMLLRTIGVLTSVHIIYMPFIFPQCSGDMLSKARALVQEYTAKQLYDTALFWADKALTLSDGDITDLSVYTQALYHCGQYQRAVHVLQSNPLLNHSPALKYLAAKCHAASKEWEDVLALLKPPVDDFGEDSGQQEPIKCPAIGNVQSASLVLQGTAYEGLGNLHDAVECYKHALAIDVFCEEALDCLCQRHTLTADDEKSLLSSLPFKKQCSVEEERIVRFLYQQKLRHARKPELSHAQTHKALQPFCTNLDVLCNVADHHFHNMNVNACYQLTSKILEKDPYHSSTLLLHTACCVQKKKPEELFSLGHRLVNCFPQSPLAWYAVGCYYIAVAKHQSARRYLTKSVSLDPHFAPAHLAFGLSFATEGEHDQAVAAFSNAARVMRGSHLPLMYLGKEYYLSGAVSTATRFMKSALAIEPHDPTLLQEIGVMLMNSGNCEKAEKYFRQAIGSLQTIDPHVTLQAWEPLYNNLAHVYRKQKKYDLAIKMHHQALQLEPNETSTLTAIAFNHLLQGHFEDAVGFCNRSLRLKREDQFTLELLQVAMEEVASIPLELEGSGIGNLDELDPGNENQGMNSGSLGKGAATRDSADSSNDSAMTVELTESVLCPLVLRQ